MPVMALDVVAEHLVVSQNVEIPYLSSVRIPAAHDLPGVWFCRNHVQGAGPSLSVAHMCLSN